MTAMERPVTAEQMRRILGPDEHGQLISRATFRRWADAGWIPSWQPEGGRRMFVPSLVAKAIRSLPANGATKAAS